MSILLCYDGSSSAKHALSVAHATLGHRPLTLLHVWSPPPEVLADASSAKALSGGPSKAELERVVFERAQALVERVRSTRASSGSRCRCVWSATAARFGKRSSTSRPRPTPS
jgi:hypothetical protein